MTGRSDSDKIDPDRGNTSGRLLFGAALIFAVGATLTLVFETSAQWLKLAVIAALWAAFFGAMLSVKYRHQAAARAGEVADLQAVYELELEREVAARREYELEIEADTRRRIAEENEDSSRADITALRTELRALRENLERLTGGEVLVERFALRAQSTRMRTIGDSLAAPAITAGPGPVRQVSNHAPARTVDAVLDPSTQLLEPAPRPQRPRPDNQRPDGQRPDTQRPDRQRSDGQRADTQRPDRQRPDSQRPDNQRPEGSRPRRDESAAQRRPEPPHVPAQATGEQSRTNIRRGPVTPPLPRQPGNTGAAPIMVRAAANAGPHPTGGRRPDDTGAPLITGRRPDDSGANPLMGRRVDETGANPIVGRPTRDRPIGDSGSYPVGDRMADSGAYPVGDRMAGSGSYPAGGRAGNSGSYPVGDRMADSGSYPAGSRAADSGSYPVGGRAGGSGVYPVGGRSSESGGHPVGGRSNSSGVYSAVSRASDSGGYPVGNRLSDTGSYPVGGRHPGNSGAYPVAGRQPGGTGANPVVSRPTGNRMPARQSGDTGMNPVAGRSGGRGDGVDPSAVPTRFAAPVAEPGGRRRAPDDFDRGGRHGSGSFEPVPQPAYASVGARRTESEPAGAHTAGRSVTELIAANSQVEDSPRRHRRRAD